MSIKREKLMKLCKFLQHKLLAVLIFLESFSKRFSWVLLESETLVVSSRFRKVSPV